jgi:hypothetical protein
MRDPLSSWREGPTKQAIVDFVARVTRIGPDFVPIVDRVAVFDNDGTLWCEKPLAIQGDFLIRGLAEMAERDPSLKSRQPWKSAVERNYDWITQANIKHYRGDDSDRVFKFGAESRLESFLSGLRVPTDGRAAEVFEGGGIQ